MTVREIMGRHIDKKIKKSKRKEILYKIILAWGSEK
jgi:hypothetical protein